MGMRGSLVLFSSLGGRRSFCYCLGKGLPQRETSILGKEGRKGALHLEGRNEGLNSKQPFRKCGFHSMSKVFEIFQYFCEYLFPVYYSSSLESLPFFPPVCFELKECGLCTI